LIIPESHACDFFFNLNLVGYQILELIMTTHMNV